MSKFNLVRGPYETLTVHQLTVDPTLLEARSIQGAQQTGRKFTGSTLQNWRDSARQITLEPARRRTDVTSE